MKTVQITLLICLTALVISQARGDEAKTAKKDLAQLQGEWVMTIGSRDGQSVPDAMLKNSKRTCKGDETTVVIRGKLLMRTKITLDPSKKPKCIDYQITGGTNAGKTQLGIYEIDGDTVKFCFSTPGKDRPTDFATKAGRGRTYSVWKREKK